MKKNFICKRLKPWVEARKKFKLSDAHIHMARELGMNPKNFANLANHKQERWKAPLPEFIEGCYRKRFGKSKPENVRSIEQILKDKIKKKEEKRERKLKLKPPQNKSEANKHPRVGVGVLVLKDNKILLGKRINAHGAGTWCPPGGHLEFGEQPQNCAARELLEETGLTAKNVIYGPWTNDIFEEEGKHYLTVYMIVTEFEGTLSVEEPDKCLSWDWFPFDELPSPLFLSLSNFLTKNSLHDHFEGICKYQMSECQD